VPFGRVQLADYHDDHVLAMAKISVLPGEQFGATEPNTPADLIGLGEGVCDPGSVLRKQIGMTLRDVPRPFLGHLNLTVQVGAWVAVHRIPWFRELILP
jgi:hypothetical protein